MEVLGERGASWGRPRAGGLAKGASECAAEPAANWGTNQWSHLPRDSQRWGRIICWSCPFVKQPHQFLEKSLVIPVQVVVTFSWKLAGGEMGGKVSHKIGLGAEGLAAHQGMSETRAQAVTFTIK